MNLFWLSFSDGDKPRGEQFLGVAIVEAEDFGAALILSHGLGINPGGEVAGIELPEHLRQAVTPYLGQLLDRARAEEVNQKISEAVDAARPRSLH